MASFFEKALGVFVEFEDDKNKVVPATSSPISIQSPLASGIISSTENQAEAEKFEKYFDRLFDQANLPGPDYFEFYKMMETLEVHIHDEKARLSATFASLSIQGLTKQTLVDSANKYKAIIEKDKADFEKALKDKLATEVGQRQKELQTHEKKIATNSEQIQKLTKEITESQSLIGKLKKEVADEETKLAKNNNGYQLASQAIINKIISDTQKIQSTL
jgi:flagellar motility protein MotE (MotC chaperone)